MRTPEEDLLGLYQTDIDQRLNRWNSVKPTTFIGPHYFAQASTECYRAYRDGHFLVATMGCHAVNEGIIRFLAERNNLAPQLPKECQLLCLLDGGAISPDLASSSMDIIRCYRNDYHHLNPIVGNLPHPELSLRLLLRLSVIENELFGGTLTGNGGFSPFQPKYYNPPTNGLLHVYLREM